MQLSPVPELVLVEDSPDDERLSLRAISQCGIPCRVVVHRDGEEALSHLLSNESQKPALILLDFELPMLNGGEVLASLRNNSETRYIPVVIFSGQESEDSLKRCYESGANSFVSKPSKADDYLAEVSRIVEYWLSTNRTITR